MYCTSTWCFLETVGFLPAKAIQTHVQILLLGGAKDLDQKGLHESEATLCSTTECLLVIIGPLSQHP